LTKHTSILGREEHLGSYVGGGSGPCSENIGGEQIKWLLLRRKQKQKKNPH